MKNRNYKNEFNYMRSKGRAVLHHEILPRFASFFTHGDRVVDVGRHIYWDYSSYFFNPVRMCDYIQIDTQPGLKDQDTQEPIDYVVDDICQSKMEDNSVNGFVFIGMHDNINNAQKAYDEMYRMLKPGGRILVAFPGNGASCGGRLTTMFDWADYVNKFIIDEVTYVYKPENNERYTDGPNTSILVIARKPL